MIFSLIINSILNVFWNLVTLLFVILFFLWLLSSIFGGKSGSTSNAITGISNILTPAFKWFFEKLFLTLKVLGKWLLFTLEKIVMLIAELLKKLFELIVNPNS